MPRRPAIVTQTEIERAIRAAQRAGARAVEVPTEKGPPLVIRLDNIEERVASDDLEWI